MAKYEEMRGGRPEGKARASEVTTSDPRTLPGLFRSIYTAMLTHSEALSPRERHSAGIVLTAVLATLTTQGDKSNFRLPDPVVDSLVTALSAGSEAGASTEQLPDPPSEGEHTLGSLENTRVGAVSRYIGERVLDRGEPDTIVQRTGLSEDRVLAALSGEDDIPLSDWFRVIGAALLPEQEPEAVTVFEEKIAAGTRREETLRRENLDLVGQAAAKDATIRELTARVAEFEDSQRPTTEASARVAIRAEAAGETVSLLGVLRNRLTQAEQAARDSRQGNLKPTSEAQRRVGAAAGRIQAARVVFAALGVEDLMLPTTRGTKNATPEVVFAAQTSIAPEVSSLKIALTQEQTVSRAAREKAAREKSTTDTLRVEKDRLQKQLTDAKNETGQVRGHLTEELTVARGEATTLRDQVSTLTSELGQERATSEELITAVQRAQSEASSLRGTNVTLQSEVSGAHAKEAVVREELGGVQQKIHDLASDALGVFLTLASASDGKLLEAEEVTQVDVQAVAAGTASHEVSMKVLNAIVIAQGNLLRSPVVVTEAIVTDDFVDDTHIEPEDTSVPRKRRNADVEAIRKERRERIGPQLSQLRQLRGMKREVFAERIGTNEKDVAIIENGGRNIMLEEFQLWLDALREDPLLVASNAAVQAILHRVRGDTTQIPADQVSEHLQAFCEKAQVSKRDLVRILKRNMKTVGKLLSGEGSLTKSSLRELSQHMQTLLREGEALSDSLQQEYGLMHEEAREKQQSLTPGEASAAIRRDLGIRQSNLLEDVSQSVISAIETGRTSFTYERLSTLYDLFVSRGVSVDRTEMRYLREYREELKQKRPLRAIAIDDLVQVSGLTPETIHLLMSQQNVDRDALERFIQVAASLGAQPSDLDYYRIQLKAMGKRTRARISPAVHHKVQSGDALVERASAAGDTLNNPHLS
ncbi:MAG: hypothetical protein AAB553_02225 [Patescibacteria group bacterium]